MIKTKTKTSHIAGTSGYVLAVVLATFIFSQIKNTLAAPTLDISAYIIGADDREIPDQNLNVTFSLYTVPTGDTGRVWQETKNITLKNGILKAKLGEDTSLPSFMDFSTNEFYLGIKIADNSESSPRKRITIFPFSLNALKAKTALDTETINGATIGTSQGNIPTLSTGGKFLAAQIPTIKKLGVVSTGTWEADKIASGYIAAALTGKTYNGIAVTSTANGFSLTKGTSKLTLDGGNLSTNAMGSSGTVVYSDGSKFSFTSQGSAGQVLISQGSGAPIWSSVSGGIIVADSLDFTELKDDMTLDNNLTITAGSFNIGIGTTNPVATLDVIGSIRATSLTINGQATLGTSGENITLNSSLIPSTTGLNLGSSTNHWANLYVDNLTVSGTDLNGTTAEYFHINTDAVVDEISGLRFYRGSALNGYSALVWEDGSVNHFTLFQKESDATLAELIVGNLGIGTTNPGEFLDVNGSMKFNGYITSYGYGAYRFGTGSAGIFGNGYTTTNDYISLQTNNTPRIWIDGTGNVGIGTINPEVALDVSGTIRSRGTNNASLAGGANPTLTLYDTTMLVGGTRVNFSAGTQSGFKFDKVVDIGYAMTDAPGAGLRVNGNVGIGTTSPAYNLQVAGTLGIGGTAYFAGNVGIGTTNPSGNLEVLNVLKIDSTTRSLGVLLGIASGYKSVAIGESSSASQQSAIALGGGARALASSAVSVGAGAASGANSLVLGGSGAQASASKSITIGFGYNGSGNGSLNNNIADSVLIGTNNGVRDFVDFFANSSGNVGIGTTNPTYNLQVAGTLGVGGTAYFAGNVGIGTTSPIYPLEVTPSSGYAANFNGSGIFIKNMTSYEAGRIWSSGAGYTIQNTYLNDSYLRLCGWNTNFSSIFSGIETEASQIFSIDSDNNDTTRGFYFASNALAGSISGSNVLMSILENGNVGIGTTNPQYTLDVKASGTGPIVRFNNDNSAGCSIADGGTISCTSDRRFKKNIEEITYGLSAIMSLEPVEYNWKTESNKTLKSLGFIAQDVENVIPKLVTTDMNNNKQLNTIGLIPVITKAIQELASSENTQQDQVSNISYLVSGMNADISRLSDSTLSTEEKISLIRTTLDNNDEAIKNLQSDLNNLEDSYNIQDTKYQILADQMKTLQDQNQAIIDFAVAMNMDLLVYKDSLGNINLAGGKITAKDIEVLGVMKAKDIEAQTLKMEDQKTSGKGTILAGESKVEIKTPEASKDVKIYITPTDKLGGRGLYVDLDSIEEGKSFWVKLDGEVMDQDIRFNWLIIK